MTNEQTHNDQTSSMTTPELEREVGALVKRLELLSNELMTRKGLGHSSVRRAVAAVAPQLVDLSACARLFTECAAALFRAGDRND